MSERSIAVVNWETLVGMFGPCDQHVRMIREALGVRVTANNNRIHVSGEASAVSQATEILERLQVMVRRNGPVAAEEVRRLLLEVQTGPIQEDVSPIEVFSGRRVYPRTPGQAHYVKAIQNHDIVFCIGPAGTGKTYLAVAMAVAALREQRIRKIVLVRPAVEAGESLGFLPGDLQAKISPYLRPLMDALREMIDHDTLRRYADEDRIEVLPLAYMRGRTLNEAFMILDEAQNTTVAQMKMFLTRMGHRSKIVISGDTTQTDLPAHTRSGLVDAWTRLRQIRGIAQVELTTADIVRHPLVQAIVDAYEQHPSKRDPKARETTQESLPANQSDTANDASTSPGEVLNKETTH
ncbi:MAG: PhoH family protein [Thermogutta sp.]|nr:PhoH family protein [Thermogutta sp.]HPZ81863.1 PhoH family protein [Thermogutta sp.]HQF14730.1 PhoH family protein [Thermogutta sp.]